MGSPHREELIVVPHAPGPLMAPGGKAGRERDDLDELIDELLPDTDEGPGAFDIALVIVGVLGVLWGTLLGGPTLALVAGAIALLIGCVLPLREAYRRLQRRRQPGGVLLDASHPVVAELVQSYGSLLGAASALQPSEREASVAAAHLAVVEVATLLEGRPPGSPEAVAYAAKRGVAIARLSAAVAQPAGPAEEGPDPAALVAAREELDMIGNSSSLTRLDQLADEARTRRGRA